MQKFYIYAMLDGLLQSTLLIALLNYFTSTAWSYSIADVFVLMFFVIVSTVSSLGLFQKRRGKLWKIHLIRSATFIFVNSCYFVNQISLQLRFFPIPQRELNNAEGLVVLIAVIAFLLLLCLESIIIGIIRKCRPCK